MAFTMAGIARLVTEDKPTLSLSGATGNMLLTMLCVKRTLDSSINIATISGMSDIAKIIKEMKSNPKGVRFNDLQKVCLHYFGKPRQSGSSHCIYKTPWPGNPRVNIQSHKGKAKPYQVRQVLFAIEKIEVHHGS